MNEQYFFVRKISLEVTEVSRTGGMRWATLRPAVYPANCTR